MTKNTTEIRPILLKIKSFFSQLGRMPSYGELAELAGFASKNAAYKLAGKLIEAGWITKDETGHLRLTDAGLGTPVIGYVQAGFPSPAEEELLDTIALDDYLIRNPQSTYLLKVSGDSMIDAGIHPEDLVIVERGVTPRHGDIVVAQVDGEWTLKYFQRSHCGIVLQPANPRYPAIHATSELVIGGVVRGSVRKYG